MNSNMNVPIEKLLEANDSLRKILHQNRITLPAVERDLLLQRIRELYESILHVGTENPSDSLQEKTTAGNSPTNIPEGEKISHPVQNGHSGDEIPLREKIAFHQDEMSIAGVMQHRKIASLKQAIGINEKFLFIRELFNNETEAYQHCIDKIDIATSLAEATSILDSEYASKYSWDKEGNAYFHFTSLVERRFI
jgi:hypothetical protein